MSCTHLNFLNQCIELHNQNIIIDFLTHTLHIPLETIFLLLAFPVVMTLVGILRHIFGIKTLGAFVPTIIMFAFIAVGLLQGVFFFVIVVVTAMIMKVFMSQFRILYLPRMTILMTVVILSVLLALTISGLFNLHSLVDISLFPLLIIIILAEEFILVQIKDGTKNAAIVAGETLLITTLGYLTITSTFFINTLLKYPYIILLLIPFNVLIGKLTGLRLSEYFRFKDVIKK